MAVAVGPHAELAEETPDLRDYLRASSDRIPGDEVKAYSGSMPVEFRLIDPDRTFHLDGQPEARRDFRMLFRRPRASGMMPLHQNVLIAIVNWIMGLPQDHLQDKGIPFNQSPAQGLWSNRWPSRRA